MRVRAQNKVLRNALRQIQSCAHEHQSNKYDLVWFALNRTRYPNHAASKDIETSETHREELKKLRSNDCDFHHGFNCGVLATSRLFKQISDLSCILDEDMHVNSEDKLLQKHEEKVEKTKSAFPDLSVDRFP